MRFASKTFTSSGTWTVPSGVVFLFASGCGGGGGGGGGSGGNNSSPTLYNSAGGAGGGGAQLGFAMIGVTSGDTLTITIGAGGAGGAGGSAQGVFGSPGSVTKIVNGSSIVICQFAAASGGSAGVSATYTVNSSEGFTNISVPGCATSNGLSQNTFINLLATSGFGSAPSVSIPLLAINGSGGYSSSGGAYGTLANGNPGLDPIASIGAYVGGAHGTTGTTSTNLGGGGGAGGGGGPFGSGGAGGAGGNGSSGTGANGTAAAAVGANTGAGGGGGGAGGNGTTPNAPNGAAGGAGGSGLLTIYWLD